MPMSATPLLAMSCLMPYEFAPGIVAVTLQKVSYAPDTKSGTKRNNGVLQYSNHLIKKFHITSLSAAFRGDKICLCCVFYKK